MVLDRIKSGSYQHKFKKHESGCIIIRIVCRGWPGQITVWSILRQWLCQCRAVRVQEQRQKQKKKKNDELVKQVADLEAKKKQHESKLKQAMDMTQEVMHVIATTEYNTDDAPETEQYDAHS